MTSKALTEKHIPLNDQQGPPTQGLLSQNSPAKSPPPPPFKQASSLGTQHSPQKLQPMHKVPPSQRDSKATRLVTASLRT
jgi:hypothetical protein